MQRGTTQGCPLSPLLFALSIEPLAIALCSLGDYQGILRREREHKVSLHADDLLLYVKNPIESIPSIMSVFTGLGRISGYKLNLSKSELLPIDKAAYDLSYSLTKEQALDLAWDSAGPPTEEQALNLAWDLAGPPNKEQALDLHRTWPGLRSRSRDRCHLDR